MTEQEQKDIILSIENQFTGELSKDILLLQAEVEKYSRQKDGAALAEKLLEIAQNMIPAEQKEFLKQTIYIGDRRLDKIYGEAQQLMKNRETAKALALTKELYEHILKHFPETDTERYFSFRNLLESNLYQYLYHPTKKLFKAPFDFTLFIGAYAYNLIELRHTEEAIPVLEEAIRYNPVNPDPRFELAEAYKLLGKPEELLTAIRETMPVCTTNYAIARCYANLGYYCVETGDFDSAICFYVESAMFHDDPHIPYELNHIGQLTGRKISRPSKEEIAAAFEKYEIPHGCCRDTFHVVTSLAEQAMENETWGEAVYYMSLVFDLTHDPKAKEDLDHCIEEHKKELEAKA